MELEIVTPEKKVYTGQVEMVNFPGSDGSFGIMKDHAAIVSTLKEGTIKVLPAEGDEKELFFDIKGGVVEVNNNQIIVLAE